MNIVFNEIPNRMRQIQIDLMKHIAMGPAREVAQMIRWKLSKGYVQIPVNLTPDLKLRNASR